jgi:integrase
MSAGHIRPRGKAWEIRYPLPPGPDGKRRVETKTIRGSKRDAQRALREALSAVDRSEHVSPSKTTVGEYVAERIAGWQAAGRKGRTVGARTAENYRHLAKQLAGIADLPVQRLDLDAIEAWHITLRKRGLAPRTVRVVHGLLDRALADAVRHRLVPRNVARDQGAPATPDADAVDADADAADAAVDAPNAEQVKTLLAKLTDDLWYVPALAALSTGLRRGEQLARAGPTSIWTAPSCMCAKPLTKPRRTVSG